MCSHRARPRPIQVVLITAEMKVKPTILNEMLLERHSHDGYLLTFPTCLTVIHISLSGFMFGYANEFLTGCVAVKMPREPLPYPKRNADLLQCLTTKIRKWPRSSKNTRLTVYMDTQSAIQQLPDRGGFNIACSSPPQSY
jgi:hypothetical protein